MSERIDPVQAIRLLDAGKAQAVDVREPDEYEMGHIPGAVLLPLGQVTPRQRSFCRTRRPCGWSTAARAGAVRGGAPAGADGL